MRWRIPIVLVLAAFLVTSCSDTSGPGNLEEVSALENIPLFGPSGGDGPVGGNDVVKRDTADSWNNFALVDLNNPIDKDGFLTDWEVFTQTSVWGDTGLEPVRLVIYRMGDTSVCDPNSGAVCEWEIVGTSAVQTPTAVGFNEFKLSTPIEVKVGDYVGLVNSSVSFTYDSPNPILAGGSICYGHPGSGSGLTDKLFCSGDDRTYSVMAYGMGKITICHKPGTNAEKTKQIPQEAWNGHEGHGDHLGPC